MSTHVIELRLEWSHETAQPYLVRIYDVSRLTAALLAYTENYTSKAAGENVARVIISGNTTYEVFQGSDQNWYWRIKGANGETLARSAPGFGIKDQAIESARYVSDNSRTAVFVDRT